MWSLTVPHRHGVNGDYRVTGRCWVECESLVPVGVVDRLCESCVSVVRYWTSAFIQRIFASLKSIHLRLPQSERKAM